MDRGASFCPQLLHTNRCFSIPLFRIPGGTRWKFLSLFSKAKRKCGREGEGAGARAHGGCGSWCGKCRHQYKGAHEALGVRRVKEARCYLLGWKGNGFQCHRPGFEFLLLEHTPGAGIREPSQTVEDTRQVVPNPTGCLQCFQGTSAGVQFWTEKMPFTAHPYVLSPRSHLPLSGTTQGLKGNSSIAGCVPTGMKTAPTTFEEIRANVTRDVSRPSEYSGNYRLQGGLSPWEGRAERTSVP